MEEDVRRHEGSRWRLLTHLGFAPQQPESLAHALPHDAETLRAHV